jgi:hypothetical protein
MRSTFSLLAVILLSLDVSAQWLTSENNIYFTKGFVGVGGMPGYRFHVKSTDQSNAAVIETPDATFGFLKAAMELRAKASSTLRPGIAWYSSSGTRLFTLGARAGGLGVTLETPNNFLISGGNVGIGVEDTRGYMLAVGGKFVAEEVVVKLKGFWPDYVFDSQYSLMPLDDLSRFIHKNRHLPEVPSAASVSKTGIVMGDIAPLLLKKIEELTLYLLEERELNKSLEHRLDVLEEQLIVTEKK